MSHAGDELIQRFYEAFGRKDGDEMAACYAPEAHFSDPVFTDLRDGEPGAMWRMLTGGSTDLEVELLEHEADGDAGSARWLAHYTFTQTGRHVDNDVRARFRFRDGLIVEHRDEFDFYRWTRQALGTTGLLLGWSPIVQGKVRKQARERLSDFMNSG
ncbi:MAG: nuclear transport factor 2 family protein [Thermoleophilaceae bacterium]